MKRTILALLLATAAATAQAETIAQMNNNAGGKIQLSNEPCASRPGQMRAFSYAADGYTLEGCWDTDAGDAIQIVWLNDGLMRLYPVANFILTPAGAALRQQPQRQQQQRRSTGM